MSYDYYGDIETQKKGIISGGLYYYLLTEKKIKLMAGENSIAIPPTDTIVNVAYYPYLNGEERALVKVVEFDKERFKNDNESQASFKSTLYRIGDLPFEDMKLGTFKRYQIPAAAKASGGLFDWRREGKLFQYPFTVLEFNDHVSTPFEIKPHLFPNNTNTQSIFVKHALNAMGMYALYAKNYKYDEAGLREATITSSLNIPTTSNFYMDYMARNQAQFTASRQNALITSATATFGGAASGAAMGSKFGPWGVAGGAILGGITGLVSGSAGLRSNLAQERDAKNSPASLVNQGGDVLFNQQISDKTLYLYRLQYDDETMSRIGWYFHLYGYKQNRVLKPDIRNRYFYNYIQTQNVNLSADGIPKDHLTKLRSIYDNGTTIWHADRSGVTVGDYSKDNYEV